jgi:DNA-binding helix-turn-helix protein
MGLSQGEIARRTQLDQSYISMIERGVVDIRLSTLERILEGFQLEAVEFLQGPQDNKEKEASSDGED